MVVGLLVGASRVLSGEEPTLGGPGYISQRLFEQAIKNPAFDDRPYVKDLSIRPSKTVSGIDIVTLSALDRETNSYQQYLFAAPRPFAPIGMKPSQLNYSVSEFLHEQAAFNPALRPSNAWWDTVPATLCFYALLGAAVMGGLWPAWLRLTRGPAANEPDYGLDRFHHDLSAKLTGVSHGDAEAHIHELDEELEEALSTSSEAQSAPHEAVRMLENGPYVPAQFESEQQKKDFGGEFYPVEKHGPHGFSLVELIIVIGIIALLISFLMPSIRLARLHAQTVKCAAQLNQVGEALHSYASNNHNWLPEWSDWHTWPVGSPGDNYGPAWTVEMIPYLGNPDSPVYNCPSFPRAQKYRNYFLESQWSGRSGRSAMKLTDITRSGLFVLSGDKTNMGLYPSDPKQDDSDPDDFGAAGALLWPWTGGFYMHLGGNNVLFDDGHVALFSRYDPVNMTFHPKLMQDHDAVTPD